MENLVMYGLIKIWWIFHLLSFSHWLRLLKKLSKMVLMI